MDKYFELAKIKNGRSNILTKSNFIKKTICHIHDLTIILKKKFYYFKFILFI